MNLSGNGLSGGDNAAKASLNPNAAEFVPFALRSISNVDRSVPGKAILDRSESSITNNSDDDAHQYWRHQLPDDITPDFKTDDTQGVESLPFSSLALTDFNEGPRYSSTTALQQGSSPRLFLGNAYAEKPSPRTSSYGEYISPSGFQSSLARPWDKQITSNDPFGNSRRDFLTDASNGQLLGDNADVNPIEFLASQFPGFAVESVAEVFLANGGDLNLTIEMLSQLEVDGVFNETLNSNAMPSPNLTSSDLPALPATEPRNGFSKFSSVDFLQNGTPYSSSEKENTFLHKTSSSLTSRGAMDFASAIRKTPSLDSSIWKYERNGSSGTNIGSSQVLTSSYNSGGQGRSIYAADRLRNRGSTRAPIWVETGEAVANMYSETREEARDHGRVRNAYFEQARQAYLAKELSIKGQLHNMQMKVAHVKAQESVYRQRNQEMHINGRERMIDLHGLHVNEAIHVLKRELAVLRNAARSADRSILAYICVGTRGSRLSTTVQRYLLEEEGLDYSEPQTGLLRVVVY